MNVLAALPSPSHGVWHLGPVPLRAYAFAILLGIVVAVWLGNRRWIARGGSPSDVGDIAVWAIPFGLVGARLYHVVTAWDPYFGADGDPLLALQIWRGGLGIWGAIAGGALGTWIACRRAGIPLPALADALAPGIALAQAIGRWGNWFNQELFGRPTDLPWCLRIDPANRPPGYETAQTFHPTFLYESLWNVGVAILVIAADRRFRLGHGRAFALYVAAYTLGRTWIESLRIDSAHEILGLRLNVWTSLIVFTLAVAYIVISARLRPGREQLTAPPAPGDDATGEPSRDEPTTAAQSTIDSDPAGGDKDTEPPPDPNLGADGKPHSRSQRDD